MKSFSGRRARHSAPKALERNSNGYLHTKTNSTQPTTQGTSQDPSWNSDATTLGGLSITSPHLCSDHRRFGWAHPRRGIIEGQGICRQSRWQLGCGNRRRPCSRRTRDQGRRWPSGFRSRWIPLSRTSQGVGRSSARSRTPILN